MWTGKLKRIPLILKLCYKIHPLFQSEIMKWQRTWMKQFYDSPSPTGEANNTAEIQTPRWERHTLWSIHTCRYTVHRGVSSQVNLMRPLSDVMRNMARGIRNLVGQTVKKSLSQDGLLCFLFNLELSCVYLLPRGSEGRWRSRGKRAGAAK